MLIRPCGDQTQLSSGRLGTFTYFPPVTLVRHSTREKLTRHWSPVAGVLTGAREAKAAQGKAISTVQARPGGRGARGGVSMSGGPAGAEGGGGAGAPRGVVDPAALAVGLRQKEIPA